MGYGIEELRKIYQESKIDASSQIEEIIGETASTSSPSECDSTEG